ncbi:MAG: PAS domain S-box protein [Desulfobacterales bacterium]|nr:PAS domain S-box protein [Desulfobacterales bacterium]MDJ0915355.1 PAS domain S-box protein [Desulfobacterales bacterium]
MVNIQTDDDPKKGKRKLEKSYRELFNHISDLVMIHNLDGRLLDVNLAVCRLSGYTLDELIGRSIDEFIIPKFRHSFRDKYLKEIKTHGYAEGEFIVLAKDGSEHHIEYRNILVKQKGQNPCINGLGRDITDRKLAEKALQKAHEEMEQRVMERTADLVEANERLKRETKKHQQTEEKLRVEQKRYALATRAANVGVWDLDLQTNEFYLDPNVKAILGYSDAEIPNDIEIWSSYVHPDDQQAVMEAFQAHIDEKTPEFVFEHRMLHKDGSIRWILARGTAMRDKQGNPIRVVGTDTDITRLKQVENALLDTSDKLERRVKERTATLARLNEQLKRDIIDRERLEQELRENEERCLALADASFEAVFISENGICIDTNRTATEMFGYDHDELIGIFGTEVIAQESRELVKQNMLSGYEEPYEAIAQRKDGTTFHVEIRGKMTEYNGRPVRVTVVHDIDKSKKMAHRLSISERKYREIFELSPEAIVLLDKQGNIVDANASLYDWLGYSREELVGKSFLDLPILSKEDKLKTKVKFTQRMAGKKVSPYELAFYTKSGAKRIGQVLANPIQDANGEIIQDLGMISDITERKQTEQALREREAELQNRTRDLEELNAALKVLLKKRESDKSELEERVLLNAKELVIPYLEKLRKSPTNSLQQAYLSVLENNLNEIVSPFYRTLSANYAQLTPKEIQVAALVRQGQMTKEIAEMMCSTPRAIEFHRNNIRKKLGLTNQKTNLRSYLMTLS